MLIISSNPDTVRNRLARLMRIPEGAKIDCHQEGRYMMIFADIKGDKVELPGGFEMSGGVATVTLNGSTAPHFFGPGDKLEIKCAKPKGLTDDEIFFKVFVDGFTAAMGR